MPVVRDLTYQTYCGRTDHDCDAYLSPPSINDQAHNSNFHLEHGVSCIQADGRSLGQFFGAAIMPFPLNPFLNSFFLEVEYRIDQRKFSGGTPQRDDLRLASLLIEMVNQQNISTKIVRFIGNFADYVYGGGVLDSKDIEVGYEVRRDTITGLIDPLLFPGGGNNILCSLKIQSEGILPNFLTILNNPSTTAIRPETDEVITDGMLLSVKLNQIHK